MTETTCAVNGCGKPIKRKALCYGHYMKAWRYGTPTPEHSPRWEDIRGRRYGTLTVVERKAGKWICQCDCGDRAIRSAGELNRTGDTSVCGTPGRHYRTDAPGYSGAHGRVRSLRGSASAHRCVDCGGPASHWSYNHDDLDELVEQVRGGYTVAYSTDPQHYSSRCVPCHKRYDLHRLDAARQG